MKKIIFIHLLNDYSGSPKVLSQVISSCKNEGFGVALYTGKNSEGFLSNITKNHYLYFYKRFENKYFTLFSFMFSQLLLFFKLLKYHNKDVVFYVNTMLPFGAGLAGKLLGKPVFYHVHETSIKPKMLKRFLRFIAQITATKIIFVSKFLKEAEPFENIAQKVVYNALPDGFSKKALNSQYQSIDNNANFNVLMICSLKTYKGIFEFLEIANICENNPNIKFTLILNAEKREIKDCFSTISISSNLTIVDKQTDLHPYYKKASLVLNLSRINQCVETFGLTILEAMAFGVSVIAPPVGGPAEIVIDGVNGYLISSYEIDRIANKIIELSEDVGKCLELSENARIRSKDFDEKTFNKKILILLNE